MEKHKWSSNIFEVYQKWKRIHEIEVGQVRLKRVLSINNREGNDYDAFAISFYFIIMFSFYAIFLFFICSLCRER